MPSAALKSCDKENIPGQLRGWTAPSCMSMEMCTARSTAYPQVRRLGLQFHAHMRRVHFQEQKHAAELHGRTVEDLSSFKISFFNVSL